MAEVRPRRVTLPACGECERVRDVSRIRRRVFSGRTGGFFRSDGWFLPPRRGEGDGWTPRNEVIRMVLVYRHRWTGTETFHRDGKQELGLGDCQVHNGEGQTRHVYLVSAAYSLLMRSLH
jgi:hypothetical protein